MNFQIFHKDQVLLNKLKTAAWFLGGLCVGVVTSYAAMSSQLNSAEADNTDLGNMINQQSLEISQLRNQLGAQVNLATSSIAEAPLIPRQPVSAPRSQTYSTPPVTVPKKQTIAPIEVQRVPVQVAHTPSASVSAPAPSSTTPTVVAASTPSIKTVKATFSQANIAGMDGSGITFRTGLNVSIGGLFPSGEKLLSVSPSEKKIVTDRRVILLRADDESIAR